MLQKREVDVKVSSNLPLESATKYPETASMGNFVLIHEGANIAEGCAIAGYTQIWSNVCLGEGVILESGVSLEQPTPEKCDGIVFGRGCKIGANSVIHQGVNIGQGAVVKPASVVEQNVPSYAIVRGNPAQIIGYVENAAGGISAKQQFFAASIPEGKETVRLGVGDVKLHRLKLVQDMRGDLSVGEFTRDIPFEPKRYFLVFNVPSAKTRGEHAHRECHQFLICVKGSCAVVVDDGESRCEVLLDSPSLGLHLPPLTWGIQYKYSPDAVLLVFTSDYYDADDYIRDYATFIEVARRPNSSSSPDPADA